MSIHSLLFYSMLHQVLRLNRANFVAKSNVDQHTMKRVSVEDYIFTLLLI